MKKHLEFAGIHRVESNLDYTHQEPSEVTLKISIVGVDDNLLSAQNELVQVVQAALQAHVHPKPNFEHYDRMRESLKTFDWSKHFAKASEQQ